MTLKPKPNKAAVPFLAALFKHSVHPVFITGLTNERGAGSSPQLNTRSSELVERYTAIWDRPGHGVFFCVATLKPRAARRAKETLAELVCLHADLDSKHIDASLEEIQVASLASKVPLLPTLAVSSGHGLHLYWRLRRPLPATPENIMRVETALKKVAAVFAGDPSVCEVSRLMRVPGSHNTKGGEWLPVHVVASRDKSYSIEELERWLSTAEPLLKRRLNEKSAPNFFSELGEAQSFAAPVDVDARLTMMEFHGPDEFSVHRTQLSVTAALLTRGWPIDYVVDFVLKATAAAVGPDGRDWDWRQEERDLQKMCRKWLEKHPQIVFVED
jgi:hypothetical protein